MRIELKEIERNDEAAFTAFCERYKKECGKEKIPFMLNPKNLPFGEFFKLLESCKQQETLPEGFVLAKYFLIRNENIKIVGGICLRYQDSDFVLNYAGHIGYGIAPWERNKGYAKAALKSMLVIAKDLGLNTLLLTTDIDNAASTKVIAANGGVLEKTENDKRFYRINLGAWKEEESAMAIVVVKNKILSTQENVYGRVVLSLPKGHIEANETHADTAIRECFEETGVEIARDDFLFELPAFVIKFVDHHFNLVKKTIYPVVFTPKTEKHPIITEERICQVKYMEKEKFLKECSYDNVRGIVKQAFDFISRNNYEKD